MPPRSALLRAIRKFLARQQKRRQRRDETSSVPQFHGIVADPTNNSFLLPLAPRLPLARSATLAALHHHGAASLPLSALAAVSLARYLPRSIGRSVYCFKRKSAPERNVFPVVSRVVWPLKYKQPSESRGPKLGIRLARQEVIWRVAREHLGRTESFRPPRPAPRVRVPRGTSRNCDKEVANHRRDGRARRFRRFASPAELLR